VRFDTPPPEPLASAVGFLLSWNGQRTAYGFAEALRPLGLRPPHFGVMNLIEAAPARTQHELGSQSMIDPSSMVAVLDELENLELVERRPNSADRRKHEIHLTSKGKRTLGSARRAAAEFIDELLEPLTERERETLRKLLRKLAGLSA
jgi:DNA-binding MarR family transcriptional regulator